jgi:hypothetical protein
VPWGILYPKAQEEYKELPIFTNSCMKTYAFKPYAKEVEAAHEKKTKT